MKKFIELLIQTLSPTSHEYIFRPYVNNVEQSTVSNTLREILVQILLNFKAPDLDKIWTKGYAAAARCVPIDIFYNFC